MQGGGGVGVAAERSPGVADVGVWGKYAPSFGSDCDDAGSVLGVQASCDAVVTLRFTAEIWFFSITQNHATEQKLLLHTKKPQPPTPYRARHKSSKPL